MGKTSKVYGVDYSVLRFNVSMETPYLVKQASLAAGYPSASAWMRALIAEKCAELLGEDRDEIMANMPPTWEDCPGAARPNRGSLSSMSSE